MAPCRWGIYAWLPKMYVTMTVRFGCTSLPHLDRRSYLEFVSRSITVLAISLTGKYDGTYWSLLSSKWKSPEVRWHNDISAPSQASLKQLMNATHVLEKQLIFLWVHIHTSTMRLMSQLLPKLGVGQWKPQGNEGYISKFERLWNASLSVFLKSPEYLHTFSFCQVHTTCLSINAGFQFLSVLLMVHPVWSWFWLYLKVNEFYWWVNGKSSIQ